MGWFWIFVIVIVVIVLYSIGSSQQKKDKFMALGPELLSQHLKEAYPQHASELTILNMSRYQTIILARLPEAQKHLTSDGKPKNETAKAWLKAADFEALAQVFSPELLETIRNDYEKWDATTQAIAELTLAKAAAA